MWNYVIFSQISKVWTPLWPWILCFGSHPSIGFCAVTFLTWVSNLVWIGWKLFDLSNDNRKNMIWPLWPWPLTFTSQIVNTCNLAQGQYIKLISWWYIENSLRYSVPNLSTDRQTHTHRYTEMTNIGSQNRRFFEPNKHTNRTDQHTGKFCKNSPVMKCHSKSENGEFRRQNSNIKIKFYIFRNFFYSISSIM